jgi:hypothetical protein
MKHEFLTADVDHLLPYLETVLQDGGRRAYEVTGTVAPLKFQHGMSGFEYREDGVEGQLLVGLILGGTGYALKRFLRVNGDTHERHDYFNIQGDLTFTVDREALKSLVVDFHEMDLSCPILNHLYNFLSLEYKNAGEGRSQTALVHGVETFLRALYRSPARRLPIEDKTADPAVAAIYHKILAAELDPVLTWEERQLVFGNYRKERDKILGTKIRAHRLSALAFSLRLFFRDAESFFARVVARPLDNFLGLLYRYTVGKVIWFFQTVRNNLGYSIALAVYGPFTYYFITMPMNPHAMQAVGRVRATYLEAKTELGRLVQGSDALVGDLRSREAIAAPKVAAPAAAPTTGDAVSTAQAAPAAAGKEAALLANLIYQSPVTSDAPTPFLVNLGNGAIEKATPAHLNMLLSTDSEGVNRTSWAERMSNFKQMQIAYEENIEFASRMGRLEQLETQYNFPMQLEATWEELERYNQSIFRLRAENPNLSAKMKQFLFNEINRTQQLQLYLWDRMGRFILDQIYVMLDQDKEQKRNDYYVGRAFVFMEEMTNILSWRYKDLKTPAGYEKIKALAAHYAKNRKETGTVLRNLVANSELFKQKDVFDTKEFRGYMKRQWEILYLQNAKAEEASNMGLNMYIWSVRNTVWVLQSIYSAKREELALLMKRDVSGQLLTPAEMLSRSKVSMLYETLLHNLTLEYVGIREEIKNRLGKDIESTQRMTVIENLKEFLSDREKLDNLGMASNQKTAGTKI